KISTMKSSRTEILLETSQKLQKAKNKEEIYLETNLQLNRLLDKVIIFYPVEDNYLKDPLITGNNDYNISKLFEKDLEIVDWVYRNNQSAGISTNTFSNAHALYLSIRSANKCFGVVGIAMNEYEELPIFERSLLSAMLNEIALALDKFYLNEARELMKMEAEKERLRANLLRSISHDLRTPLTSISGNANILLDTSEKLDRSTKKALYKDIYEDSLWLINLVENLLAVTRIENGSIAIRLVPELIEEVVIEALNHCRKHQGEHNIVIDNQAEFIMAKLDTRLIIQVIVNLVDNAVKYTNGNSTIIIKEYVLNDYIHVEVIDEGVGIKDTEKENIFKMFYTVNNSIGDARRGLGLGLSLCKSIIDAHGGIIYIKDNKPTGSIIGFTLKKEEVNINERNDTCS
ncbi:MAG: ATP-binding protein, partial [Erysipelotrichaceae bacterium]